MQKYNVVITETLKRKVPVQADSLWEAEQLVNERYQNAEIILDYKDFVGVEITVESQEVL